MASWMTFLQFWQISIRAPSSSDFSRPSVATCPTRCGTSAHWKAVQILSGSVESARRVRLPLHGTYARGRARRTCETAKPFRYSCGRSRSRFDRRGSSRIVPGHY
jgi:hypothetical protein